MISNLLSFGMLGSGSGFANSLINSAFKRSEEDKNRSHEKEMLVYKTLQKKQDNQQKLNEMAISDVQHARKASARFIVSRRMVVITLCLFILLMFVVAFHRIPFVVMTNHTHNILGMFKWTSEHVNYLNGMPIPEFIPDAIMFVLTFLFGQKVKFK